MALMFSQSGPQRYISDETAYQVLPNYFHELGLKTVVFLHGEKGYAVAKPFLPKWPADVSIIDVPFNGECSYEEIDRVKKICADSKADAIMALGGGKCLDTAKSVANGTKLAQIMLPTLASNCAAWSALSVHYRENHEHIDHKIYLRTSELLLINPKVIFNSPLDYFVAGIGDTLAKFYESERVFEHLKPEEFTDALIISQKMAKQCQEILLKYGVQAVEDMKNGNYNENWRQVAETIIVTAGTVGGWGDAYARATAAHPVCDALTAFPRTHHHLHGAKVAYGIFVMLALENQEEDLKDLLPFYRQIGLPTNLTDLDFGDATNAELDQLVADITAPNTQLHLLPATDISPAAVHHAITRVEELTQAN